MEILWRRGLTEYDVWGPRRDLTADIEAKPTFTLLTKLFTLQSGVTIGDDPMLTMPVGGRPEPPPARRSGRIRAAAPAGERRSPRCDGAELDVERLEKL